MKSSSNARGFSMVELISVMAVVALLTAVAAYGISIFFYKFKALTAYADLQQDAMEVLMQMKNGVPIGSSSNAMLLGVASSTTITFPPGISENGISHDITCTSPNISEGSGHTNDYVRFYWDQYDGTINLRYQYGLESPSNPIVIFPTNHKDAVRVTNLTFTYMPGTARNVIRVILEAEIRITKKEVRRVHYETYMRTSWI
jgi:prepilin-type N-terminal cleavage/methylation domain-containing protein